MMSNREKCKKALYDYIDSLDDKGIFNFIIDQEVIGTSLYDCVACEKEHGSEECSSDTDICEKRFIDWLNERKEDE